MLNKYSRILSAFFVGALVLGFTAPPNDWPQWRGPNRDGISQETGILTSWPEDGPKVLWRGPGGDGYSAMSVVDGRLFTTLGMGSEEVAICLDADTGKELWRFTMDSKYSNQWGHGPRSTPTVDDGVVYVLSAKAKLFALDAKTGKEIWGHDLQKKYGAQIPTWGVATSPLAYQNMLIVDVGGSDGYGIVAFNKKDGNVIWKTATDVPGYSAPIAVTVGGIEQILTFTGKALVSVSPEDGTKFWDYGWITDYDVNAATPIFIEPDRVFISSGYGTGAAVLKMIPKNGDVTIEEVWRSRVMRNHFSSSVLIDGFLYGFDEGTLKCVDVNNQETKWAKRGFQKGSLIYADGHLIILSERGVLALVQATPEEYIEKAQADMLDGRCWTVPTLVDGKLYIRNQKEMLCLDFSS